MMEEFAPNSPNDHVNSLGAGALDSTLSLTDAAIQRILALQASEEPGHLLRLSVQSGGCSGFQYHFSFDDTVNPDDCVIERDGAKLVVDIISLGFLAGAVLDYTSDMMMAQFVLTNPVATSRCGCGNSFAV